MYTTEPHFFDQTTIVLMYLVVIGQKPALVLPIYRASTGNSQSAFFPLANGRI
jgi:hypothetical protein